jgi:hypothetical protein
MAQVTAKYSSATHSLVISHPVNAPDGSLKASLNTLREAILSTQADLNAFLTERKLEEDRANHASENPLKRKVADEENGEENEGGEEEDE